MFLKFYKHHGTSADELAKEFAGKVMANKKNVSPAQIQGFFMFYKNDPEKVLTEVSEIWKLS